MKKAEGKGGVTASGVFMAILIFFLIRGCIQNDVQEDINDFCESQGFEYGIESVRNTLIECGFFDDENNNLTKFQYNDFERLGNDENSTQEK